MIYIIKRNNEKQEYDKHKIAHAISKCFDACGTPIEQDKLDRIVEYVDNLVVNSDEIWSVEQIQDSVEHALMKEGYLTEAKKYILYREKQTELRKIKYEIAEKVGIPKLFDVLSKIKNDFTDKVYSLSILNNKFNNFVKANDTRDEAMDAIIYAAAELSSEQAPKWEYIAARLLSIKFSTNLKEIEESHGIHSFYEKISYLTNEGLYGDYILSHYSREELEEAYSFIDESRNELFTYSALELLLKRYVIRSRKNIPLESPQEMYLGISLHLAMNEKNDKMKWVHKFYDTLSKLYVTMATPTLSNARRPFHQLSSCFIDTVPDSLEGIYRSIDNFAQVSKSGGGMGLYFGKVRASGSAIRGFEGAAGGVIRWIRLANDTAVAVDQLGVRQGAVAVYLDAWHKDLPEFLGLRTNNGDDRLKAHDVFPAICYPDLFWRLAKENIDADWYMMCPHEILSVKGYALEDYYGEEWEKRYLDCINDSRISKRTMSVKDIVRLILKSAVETGTPFAFNRDVVNKMNPNKHQGIIYCSNLCTEIAQNMAPIETISREIKTENGDTVVVTTTRPGDFVVCNLASLSLGHIPLNDDEILRDTVHTAIRALDNVIDLNSYPVPYAKITNRTYRSLGLGVSGYHHMLAKQKLVWESDEHLAFVDKLFEKINMYAIEESNELAKERGAYDYFEGSDWQNGNYFTDRNYTSDEWNTLKENVAKYGMRNAYLMAIAPTGSTSIIAGTSAGIDPVMNRFFLEEKKGHMLPRLAPELSLETYWFYKSSYVINQTWSIKAAGVRSRHIDQAQSMNLYITDKFTMRGVLDLYIKAWENDVKTIYYVRSKSLEVEECESCAT